MNDNSLVNKILKNIIKSISNMDDFIKFLYLDEHPN